MGKCDIKLPIDKLPKQWNDEESLSVLFGPFRNRNVNAKDWDVKLEFWRQSIISLCIENKLVTFALQDIEKAFKYNGRTPTCLNIVFSEMIKNRELVSFNEIFSKRPISWSGWAVDLLVKKPVSWSFHKLKSLVYTPDNTNVEYVCVDALDKIWKAIISEIPENLKNNILECNEMMKLVGCVGYDDFTYLFAYKSDLGEATLREVRRSSEEPPIVLVRLNKGKITDNDVDIYMLQQTEKILMRNIEDLNNQIKVLKDGARNYLKGNQRSLAKTCLRKKNDIEKRIEAREKALYNVQTLLSRIEDAKSDVKVLETYKHALDSLRNNFKDNNLTEDIVTDTMVELDEMLDTQKDLESILGKDMSGIDDSDLEAELDAFLAEQDDNNVTPKPSNISPKPKDVKDEEKNLIDLIKQLDLPDVPTDEPKNISENSLIL